MPMHCERQLPARECLLRRIYADTHGAPVACAGCDLGGGMPETPRPALRRSRAIQIKGRRVGQTAATLAILASPIPAEVVFPGPAIPRPEECELPPALAEGIKAAMETPAATPEIVFPNGSRIVGLPTEAGAIRGVLSPEAAAEAWLDQVADPAAPADGQAEFLHDMFAAEPQETQEEHEDGQAGAVREVRHDVEPGERPQEGPEDPGAGPAVPSVRGATGCPARQDAHKSQGQADQVVEQLPNDALAEAEGQAPGDLGAAPGRAAAGSVDLAAPAPKNPALAILAGVVAALCGKGIRRTSLRFLQSEFNAASPGDLAVRSPEAMAHLVAFAGLRQVAHRGEPGVILIAAEVRPC